MPLSDHEQRLLEQMERALYAEDPKFADALRKTRSTTVDRKQVVLGLSGVVLGLAVLVVGVAIQIIPLGVMGFVVMLVGAFLAYRAFTSPSRTGSSSAPKAKGSPGLGRGGGSSFMDKLEQRWQQRKERGY